MTRKSPSAPNQVELTRHLTQLIDSRAYLFVNDDEIHSGAIIPDGEWIHRVNQFLTDPETDIPSDPQSQTWATALITRRYKKYLNPRLVRTMTGVLQPVKQYAPADKEERLRKVKRDIKKL